MSEIPPPFPPPVATPPPGPPQWPQPPARKPFPWLTVILGFVGLMVAVGVVGVLSIKSWFEGESKKEIHAPHLSGNPTIVASTRKGWYTTTFPEVPLTLDLPSKAVHQPVDSSAFDEESKFLLDKYIEYQAFGEASNVYLYFNWMTSLGKLMVTDNSDVKEYAEEYVAGMSATDIRPIDLPTKPAGAIAMRFNYVYEDEEHGSETYEASYLFVPFREGMLIFGVHPTDPKDGPPTLQHMARTLKLGVQNYDLGIRE